MRIIKKIKADVARYNTFDPIPAKQSDAESRFLEVTLTNDGEALTVPADSTVTINARRSDGESKSFEGSVTDDGAVLVPLTSWMLELDDIVQCDISVISGTEKLTVMSFSVRVQRASCDGNDISSSENYDILISLIAQVKELVSESGMTTLGISGAKKGQGAIIKSVDENGVPQEWEAGDSKPFVVTVTYGGNALTADKTHAEIVAAYANGAQINAKIVNYPGVNAPSILPLYVNMSDEMFMFSGSGVIDGSAMAMTATDTNGSWRVELAELATLGDIPTEVFTINLATDSGGNITANKTFAEIKAAYDDGKVVDAKFADAIVPLRSISDSDAIFEITQAISVKVVTARFTCTSDNVWSKSQTGFDAHTLGISGASVGQTVKIKTVDSSGVPTKWEPADMPSGGGGTDTSLGLTGATVGQTVKIKAVDENGIPTEWEAADAASGEDWEFINEISTNEWISSVTINQDSNGNPFSLKKMRIFMTLPKTTNEAGEEQSNPGYAHYKVNDRNPAWQSPAGYWESGLFLWTIEAFGDYYIVSCWKDGANSSTLHHIDVFHDAGYFESITSFTWKLFNANYGWGSTNFKVYGVKA